VQISGLELIVQISGLELIVQISGLELIVQISGLGSSHPSFPPKTMSAPFTAAAQRSLRGVPIAAVIDQELV
jgi:hypothetical protein